MKVCLKEPEPPSLANFRAAKPAAKWEEMKNDAHNGGQEAYADVKRSLVRAQRGLCAYCERQIAPAVDNDSIRSKTQGQRVEHYHSKSDSTPAKNWALDWNNLWAVCTGGNNRPPTGEIADTAEFLEPAAENLSCDAAKERQITNGALDVAHEGLLLAPSDLPSFPPLFTCSSDGIVSPSENCAKVSIVGNRLPSTEELVSDTIKHFNLNCGRLTERRRIVRSQLEKSMSSMRASSPHLQSSELSQTVARRFLTASGNSCWREFFTMIRDRLGEPAEAHLRANNYAG